MQPIVQKWGNGLGIRMVDVIEEEGRLIIKPQKLTLEMLLSGITDENKHEAMETGPSIGKEV